MPLLALSLLVALQTPPIPTPPFRRIRGAVVGPSYMTLQVGKDRFYVFSGKRLACYDSGTGKLVWNREGMALPASTLRLRGSHLFLCGDSFAAKRTEDPLIAFDAASGRTLWKARRKNPGTDVAVQGANVFASYRTRTVAALDLATGKEKWAVTYRPTSKKESYAPLSTPVVASEKGVVASFGSVALGIDPKTGRERWRVEGLTRASDEDLLRVGETIALPVGRELRGYDIASGRHEWTASKVSELATGVIGSRFAVVFSDNLNLFDAATGRSVGSSPIGDPRVYGSGRYVAPFGQAFVAEGTKYLLALDATGRTRWRLPVGAIDRPIWYGGQKIATYDEGIWRLYERGNLPALPTAPKERVRFAERQMAEWDVLDSNEKKQLVGLGDELFEPLLRTYLATAKSQDSEKLEEPEAMHLYRKAIEQAELLSKVTSRKRTRDLVAALRSASPTGPEPGMGIGSGSGWQTLLTLLAQHGDPQIVAPIMVEELRQNRVDPQLMAYLNVALTYVSRSNHPEAVRYMIDALRDPKASDQICEAAYHNLAAVGGEAGVRAVLSERHRRELLPSLEMRMDLAKVGVEPSKGNITNLIKIAQDAKGRTWGLMQSSILGSYQDLWIAEREKGQWRRPIFLGLTEDVRRGKTTKDPTPTFGGKTAKQWIEGDWMKGLTENRELRLDTDEDGLTDRMEARLGSDPRKADTDGDGDRDLVDPWPTVAAQMPSSDEEAILAAAIEARYHFESHGSPAIFFAPPGVNPFEMVGWPGSVLWVRGLPDTIADHPLTQCYGSGVGFLAFEPLNRDGKWPSGYMRFNASKTEAQLSLSTYFGGLNGTVYSVRVRKFGNDWLVVGMELSSIS